jgi:hypothetical protein
MLRMASATWAAVRQVHNSKRAGRRRWSIITSSQVSGFHSNVRIFHPPKNALVQERKIFLKRN